jgi:hypothetical protein
VRRLTAEYGCTGPIDGVMGANSWRGFAGFPANHRGNRASTGTDRNVLVAPPMNGRVKSLLRIVSCRPHFVLPELRPRVVMCHTVTGWHVSRRLHGHDRRTPCASRPGHGCGKALLAAPQRVKCPVVDTFARD